MALAAHCARRQALRLRHLAAFAWLHEHVLSAFAPALSLPSSGAAPGSSGASADLVAHAMMQAAHQLSASPSQAMQTPLGAEHAAFLLSSSAAEGAQGLVQLLLQQQQQAGPSGGVAAFVTRQQLVAALQVCDDDDKGLGFRVQRRCCASCVRKCYDHLCVSTRHESCTTRSLIPCAACALPQAVCEELPRLEEGLSLWESSSMQVGQGQCQFCPHGRLDGVWQGWRSSPEDGDGENDGSFQVKSSVHPHNKQHNKRHRRRVP